MNCEQATAWLMLEGWEWTGRGDVSKDTWAWVGVKRGENTIFGFGSDHLEAYHNDVQGSLPVVTPHVIPAHLPNLIIKKIELMSSEGLL